MFDKFTKTATWIALPIASLLMLTGCDEEKPAPVVESTNLTQVEDLFSQPVKANPLANDPSAVVVRVNGEEITRGEILTQLNASMQQFAGRMPPEQMQQIAGQLYESIQDQLINQKLLEAAVAQSGTTVPEEKVTEQIDQIRANFAQQQNKPEGMDTLENLLEAQGTSIEKWSAEIREQMSAEIFLEAKVAGIKDATLEDAEKFYAENPENFMQPESVTASHILLKFDEDETDEVKAEKFAQLEKIRTDIIADTKTFEDAAKEFSDCPSGAEGGALGTFGTGRMVPEFEVAAFAQEKDEIGKIVESPFGYHLIKVTDHQDGTTVKFDDVKERIITFLTNQKKQEAAASFIKSLRDSAEIEMIDM